MNENDHLEPTSEQTLSFANQLKNFPRSLSLELGPMERPVDVIKGREVHDATLQAVEVFRRELLPKLRIGEKTRTAFESILDKIAEPEGVSIYATDQARFIRYEEWQGGRIAGQDGEPEVEMAPIMIDLSANWMQEAIQKSGVQIAPELASQLATGWIVWHEIGHGFQAAYADAASPKPPTEWVREFKADLSNDALAWGISRPLMAGGGLDIDHTVESERFAEGFGQMMVERFALSQGVEPDNARKLRETMVPESRLRRAEIAKEIVARHATSDDPQSLTKMYEELNAAPQDFGRVTINVLGYVEPYDPDQIQNIFDLSSHLEQVPWQERLEGRV